MVSQLIAYLFDMLDAGLIEIRRDNAQSHSNTSDCKNALHDCQ